MEEKRKNVE